MFINTTIHEFINIEIVKEVWRKFIEGGGQAAGLHLILQVYSVD